MVEIGENSMDGDLTTQQISDLSGLSTRFVEKSIKRGDIADRSAKSVGLWLKSLFEGKIDKEYKTKSNLHRKWD